MYKKLFVFVLMVAVGFIFYQFYNSFEERESLNQLASHYANNGKEEVGAANLVTAIVVTYRGLDTLGEVTILFLTAAIIGFFLKTYHSDEVNTKFRKSSELFVTASKALTPVVFLLGIYVFVNGHLTPGGGFQGGAIIASALVLMLLAKPDMKVNHTLIHVVESISGFSFVLLGVLGIFLAGGFLDNDILPLGEFGDIFSAGAIPIIYSFIGLKVGSELSAIIANYNQTQKTE